MNKLLGLVCVVAASAVFAEGWGPRSAAFREKQAAERKRLGLDEVKAAKAYPTPEVRFGAAWACPGETSTLLLEGKLLPGTLVGTSSPNVEIVKEELTPRGWQGTVKVKPGTKDGVYLQVIAPVSGITNSIELPLGCPHQWIIDLKNGDRLQLLVVDNESRAPGEWFHENKSVETCTIALVTDGKSFTTNQQESAEQRERVKKAQEPLNSKEAAAKQKDIAAKMQTCITLPAQQMSACMQKYQGEIQAMVQAQQGAIEQTQAAMAPKAGCQQLVGTIEGKKLKGKGTVCAGAKTPYDEVPFTGVIK